jgi:hypothetical protein
LPASDVYSWAKAASKPSYSWSEIKEKPSTFSPSSHNHSASEITSGTLPVARGGTGQTSIADIKSALGITDLVASGCLFESGTYTGTGGTGGTSQKNSLTFNFVPKVVLIFTLGKTNDTTGRGYYGILSNSQSGYSSKAGSTSTPSILHTSVSGTTISWYSTEGPNAQLNSYGFIYVYYAFGG